MIKYFRLTSSQDQYNEFNAGVDNFIFRYRYNKIDKHYYLDVYKNNKLKIKSLRLVWSDYNLFSSFKYKDIGELNCISASFNLLEDNKTKELQELTKSTMTNFIFVWRYNE